MSISSKKLRACPPAFEVIRMNEIAMKGAYNYFPAALEVAIASALFLSWSDNANARVLFVNFEGASFSQGASSSADNLSDIYTGPWPKSTLSPLEQARVIERMRDMVLDYNIQVTWDRPSPPKRYDMVMVGPVAPLCYSDVPNTVGIAPTHCDSGHSTKGVVGFVSESDNGNVNAATILHEAGHMWGLEHIYVSPNDRSPFIMTASTGRGSPRFSDRCLLLCNDVTCNFSVFPTDSEDLGDCYQRHQEHCQRYYQNSHEELLRFGDATSSDTNNPSVEIIYPEQDNIVSPFGFRFHIELEDGERSPSIVMVHLSIGSESLLQPTEMTLEAVASKVNNILVVPYMSLSEGQYTLEVSALDRSGNMSSIETVDFYVDPSMPEDSEPAITDTSDDTGTGDAVLCEPQEPDASSGSTQGDGEYNDPNNSGCSCSATDHRSSGDSELPWAMSLFLLSLWDRSGRSGRGGRGSSRLG